MTRLLNICKQRSFPVSIHIVKPDSIGINQRVNEGYQFVAYSIDSVIFTRNADISIFAYYSGPHKQ